jgi:hypothetical protein
MTVSFFSLFFGTKVAASKTPPYLSTRKAEEINPGNSAALVRNTLR